jgi:hypothetical protein
MHILREDLYYNPLETNDTIFAKQCHYLIPRIGHKKMKFCLTYTDQAQEGHTEEKQTELC